VDFVARRLERRPARPPHVVNKPCGGFLEASRNRVQNQTCTCCLRSASGRQSALGLAALSTWPTRAT